MKLRFLSAGLVKPRFALLSVWKFCVVLYVLPSPGDANYRARLPINAQIWSCSLILALA